MKIALAIITYRRLHALKETLAGLKKHCAHYPILISEDLGQQDGTEDFLAPIGVLRKPRPDLLAEESVLPNWTGAHPVKVLLGTRNLGVSGNSNKCLRWFMEETDADFLCLMNDDLNILGDFPAFYAKAQEDLGIGHCCFCDFVHHPSYRWVTVRCRGYGVKLLPRLTGIMMTVTRSLLEKIGYFDMRYGRFGEEHVDFSYRCRFAGGVKLDGIDQNGLDLEHDLLKHQEVETSVRGVERQRCDQEAAQIMAEISKRYRVEHYYRPFGLIQLPFTAGGYRKSGIPVEQLLAQGYQIVQDLEPMSGTQ